MVWADLAARLVNQPYETPVGLITSVLGVPVFLWMIRKEKNREKKKTDGVHSDRPFAGRCFCRGTDVWKLFDDRRGSFKDTSRERRWDAEDCRL